jgi:hypothetical protein
MLAQERISSTIDNIANSLKSCTPDGPLIDIKLGCLSVQPEKHNITTDIENCINGSSQKRQGTSRDRSVD